MQILENVEVPQETDRIHKTTNYDQFKLQVGNRLINKRNFKKLVESVKEQQLRIPIIVNEKMEIIDGQHRFLSWQENEKPIYYIINEGYGLQETKRANVASTNWTNTDFIRTYIEEGKESYITFKELKTTYGVSIADLLYLFTMYQNKNVKSIRDDFTLGLLSIEGADQVRLFLEHLELFVDFPFGRQTKFVKAFQKYIIWKNIIMLLWKSNTKHMVIS